MGRRADIFARVSPRFAGGRASKAGARAQAWIYRRSGGRLARSLVGVPVMVLRTTGRRSGRKRESPMFFLPHADGWAVVASNAGSPRPPAWLLNVEAKPEAEAFVDGGWHPVRARQATAAEADELWPRFVEIYRGYDHYRAISSRELAVVVLERR
jgi:deazaflavin-dependent oxidoreductase (nitroreductase family)